MKSKKRRNINTLLKYTDLQIIDRIEDIITDMEVNNSYIRLIDEYITKNIISDKEDIKDKEKITMYFYDKEQNKQAYINLLDDIRARNTKTEYTLKEILLYLREDIPLEAQQDFLED